MPLITIAIPVYNAMPYLAESVRSILRQSYGDFEILAVNDGSTDGSLEYVEITPFATRGFGLPIKQTRG